jgi:uncharacterized protein YprB with RNaseH-like and TPR domain
MSLLQERLNRFKSKLTELKKNEEQAEAQSPAHRPETESKEWQDIGAMMESNEWGTFVKRKQSYPLHYKHGQYSLGELPDISAELSGFHPMSAINCEQMLFFDTETTGLGVGAGNVPFMIGIGYYEQEHFITEQFFIRNPAEEIAMLHYFNESLSRFTHVVSYNGRTFDWPIIKNRFVLNRMKLANQDILQLDFLYSARSFWRNTLPSCRLAKVEEERLGFTRLDDVPGSLAPTLYFQYLAERRLSVIQGVFVHNEHDILSLAVLAIHFGHALCGHLDYTKMEAEELFRIGLWLDKMGKTDLAEAAITQLLVRSPAKSSEYWLAIAAFYKKKGNEIKAVKLWNAYIKLKCNDQGFIALEPFIELAMYYEHRMKQYETAIMFAEKALEHAWKQASFLRIAAFGKSSKGNQTKHHDLCIQLEKRIARLRKKSGVY